MSDKWNYFLGQGQTEEFSNFSLAHFLPILIAVAVIFVIYCWRNQIRDLKKEMNIRYIMAFMLIISEMSYFWRLVAVPALEPNPVDHLPITVCGWVVVFCSYMVVGKCQSLFDIVYFWVFSGSIFALVTPTVITYTGPTRYRYYQFWVEHLMSYVSVFYMIFVHGMRPTWKSMVKSYSALVVLAVIAYGANQMIGPGANYLFMAKPEDSPSVLDILPPNFTLRLVIMALVVSGLFFVAYLPWYLKDKKAKNACVAE